jgi:hypothetical protein
MRGLIIHSIPLQEIFAGRKTWEFRTRRTYIRGTIGLIEKGTGTVVGLCELVDCIGPLTLPDLRRNTDKHDLSKSKLRTWDEKVILYAWVLKDARRFKKPVPYKHKFGIVTWHPLPDSIFKMK